MSEQGLIDKDSYGYTKYKVKLPLDTFSKPGFVKTKGLDVYIDSVRTVRKNGFIYDLSNKDLFELYLCTERSSNDVDYVLASILTNGHKEIIKIMFDIIE